MPEHPGGVPAKAGNSGEAMKPPLGLPSWGHVGCLGMVVMCIPVVNIFAPFVVFFLVARHLGQEGGSGKRLISLFLAHSGVDLGLRLEAVESGVGPALRVFAPSLRPRRGSSSAARGPAGVTAVLSLTSGGQPVRVGASGEPLVLRAECPAPGDPVCFLVPLAPLDYDPGRGQDLAAELAMETGGRPLPFAFQGSLAASSLAGQLRDPGEVPVRDDPPSEVADLERRPCPVCAGELGSDRVLCGACGTRHHRSCLELVGVCARVGC